MKSHDTIRTFIAIEIPESIKLRIERLQEQLRRIEAKVSWTKPANVHLTLKFLGYVEASRIERVNEAVKRAASGISPFALEAGGAGCFPSSRNPRVLFVGLPDLPEPLRTLYSKIETELVREGFPKETRRFSPHLTIGRLRTSQNASTLAEALQATGFENNAFVVREIIVMRSDLKPTGSIYTPQALIKLGSSN
jgi:2'-5' RNA ligase